MARACSSDSSSLTAMPMSAVPSPTPKNTKILPFTLATDSPHGWSSTAPGNSSENASSALRVRVGSVAMATPSIASRTSVQVVGELLRHLAVEPLELDLVGHADGLEPVQDLEDDPGGDEGVHGHQRRRGDLLAEERGVAGEQPVRSGR